MNCTSAINATPTAAGSAMPATGYFKLKNVTGTFQDNETLEIQGSTDLCLANGIGQRGWIEVVMDDAATWTIGRAQNLTITGDWFESATTGSGAAHQQVQFPNYGGANFFLPGVWVDEAANGNVGILAGDASPAPAPSGRPRTCWRKPRTSSANAWAAASSASAATARRHGERSRPPAPSSASRTCS